MRRCNFLFHLLLSVVLTTTITAKEANGLFKVTGLKCEYAIDPLGLDVPDPQLSWEIESDIRGILQKAYRIMVAECPQALYEGTDVIWDTEKKESKSSAGITYEGPELKSRTKYYWRVKSWNNDEIESDWSEISSFEMGLIDEKDWISDWIAYAPGNPGRTVYFKGTYSHDKEIAKARLYICGLGFYEMRINNRKVGDHVLDPAQSTYNKRMYYSTYDVTDHLSNENVLLISVSPGWYGTPKLRMQMEAEYTDGTKDIITSNYVRAIATGPLVHSSIFDGELYDATQEYEDLYKPYVPAGLMNKEWGLAHITDSPGGKMVSQKMEPIKVVETLIPEKITEPRPGIYIIDAGRNLAGWASLTVEGPRGTEVKMKFAETLYDDGLVNQENLRYAKATDTYILKGEGIETWEPSFTYHGFRYIQVEGLPTPPSAEDIKVRVVRTAVAETGKFKCSNELLNDIHRMVVNTESSNLHSVPTDCPQRDERMGWMNDLTVRIEQAIYNFDFSRFYPKYIADVEDTQDEDGSITCCAPYRFGARPADPVSASYLLLAMKCYEFYGNRNIIRDHYDGMKSWVDFLESRTENGIVNYSYYGDWSPPIAFGNPYNSAVSLNTPGQLMSTGYLYYCADMLSYMADLLGKHQDARYYKELAGRTATAFNNEYWDEISGGYASNNQASNSFALFLGLVAPEKVSRVVDNLVNDVKEHDYHLTTGNLCTKYLLEMLTEYGHVETAYKIATQPTYPSWGYMLANGATTLWERWEYATGDEMNSHNHPMMGSVDSWFYKYILGIRPDVDHPAFEKFTIKPYIVEDLDFAEGEFISVKGSIKSAWRKQNGKLHFSISVPANSTALVYIPTGKQGKIKEGGRNAERNTNMKPIKKDSGYMVYEVGSGDYNFVSS